jgi:hypothetical protein
MCQYVVPVGGSMGHCHTPLLLPSISQYCCHDEYYFLGDVKKLKFGDTRKVSRDRHVVV